ncbi:MAG: sigma-70 family RNA polymerase sigma factor [Bacteroidales bacterium]|nr:sigma-70 family RNA polymerase sigma factor [Bacteroidales bacterium]
MIHYSDEAILEGLRLRSDYIINFIYKEYFPVIKFLVTENGGADEDAEDIFQDGIIILYNKISLNQLVLSSSFKTYMYSICRNLWLQKLSKRKAIYDKLTDVEEFIDLPKDMLQEASIEEAEMHRIIQIHFLSLPEDCQKVLKLFIKNIPLREIAGIMGFKTENYAKTRKYLCKEDLKKRIADDPRSQKFIKNDN